MSKFPILPPPWHRYQLNASDFCALVLQLYYYNDFFWSLFFIWNIEMISANLLHCIRKITFFFFCFELFTFFGAGPHFTHSTWVIEHHELKGFDGLSSFGHQSTGSKTSSKEGQHLTRTHRANPNWPDAGFWQGGSTLQSPPESIWTLPKKWPSLDWSPVQSSLSPVQSSLSPVQSSLSPVQSSPLFFL